MSKDLNRPQGMLTFTEPEHLVVETRPCRQHSYPGPATYPVEIWVPLHLDITYERCRLLAEHTLRGLQAFIFQDELDIVAELDLNDQSTPLMIIKCHDECDLHHLGKVFAVFNLFSWQNAGYPPIALSKPAGSTRDSGGREVDLSDYCW